ncbi:MAG: hypothetical protein WB586_02495 [Chthoniobacterales bacterium]
MAKNDHPIRRWANIGKCGRAKFPAVAGGYGAARKVALTTVRQ